ncbi:MAG: sensor histidine kinase [Wenzhouxiangella sp.]
MSESSRHRSAGRLKRLPRRFGRRLGTRSVLTLQLAGFALVALPLLVGLLLSGQQIDRVTRNSEQLLERTLAVIESARRIGERVTTFERAARQYRVLRDRDARTTLLQQHGDLNEELDAFVTRSTSDLLLRHTETIQAQSHALVERTLDSVPGVEWPEELAADFDALNERAESLLDDSETAAGRELERLERMGAAARNVALLSLVLTVPLAIVLALLMAGYLNRRIRRLDRGMRAMARPEQARIEQIANPRDLRALSIRMEWVRRRLARNERDRRRFVGQVSHELKTPLSAIREGTSLLADQKFGKLGREQREVIGIIQSSTDRLQEQIENLLRFNRLQGGRPRPRLQRRVRIASLIEKVLADYHLSIEARGIGIEYPRSSPIEIEGDPDMLGSALDNLVSNALKFSPEGGTIGIFLQHDADQVRIRIADTGEGIHPRDRDRLFEPFFRGNSGRARVQPGSGLGLAICRDLVRAHRGDIRLVEDDDWSTVFEIRLPLKQPGGPA